MARKPETVLELCVARLGLHRGALAAANLAQWAMATRELGQVPSTAQYAEYWAISERTGWRHRARIYEAIGDDWPRLVEQVAAAITVPSPRAVMGLPLAAPVAA